VRLQLDQDFRKILNINNQKSVLLVCYILLPSNIVLFIFHYLYKFIQFGPEARIMGMIGSGSDFVLASVILSISILRKDLFVRYADFFAFLISAVVIINSSFFVAFSGDAGNLILLAVEFMGAALLLRGSKIEVSVFLSIIAASMLAISLGGDFSGNLVIQPVIILLSFGLLVSNFRYKMDVQHYSVVKQKEELTAANAELKEAKKYIEENQFDIISKARTRSLQEMSGGVAHEINNPLAIIMGMVEYAVKKSRNNELDFESVLKMRNSVASSVERISGIVTSLRAFATISGDQLLPLMTIKDQLGTLNSLIGYTEGKSAYKFSVSVEEGVQADTELPVEVLQILAVLINNSIDAVTGSENPWIKLRVLHAEDDYTLQVVDSGVGVSPYARENIFDPFFTTKDIGAGKGLGLSEARGLAHQINGTLLHLPHSENTTFELRYVASLEKAG
jgi:signal transduction histidine kinase